MSEGLMEKDIEEKFHAALEVRHRINSEEFLTDLLLINRYEAIFAELRQFSYLENLDQSQIGKVWNATSALLNQFKLDAVTLLGDVSKVQKAYDTIYGRVVTATKKHLEENVAALHDLQEYVELNPRIDKSLHETFLAGMYDFINMKLILSSESLKNLQKRLSGLSELPEIAELYGFLPTSILAKQEDCSKAIENTVLSFDNLIAVIMEDITSSNNSRDFTILKPSEIAFHIKNAEFIVTCLTTYSKVLEDITEWSKKRFSEDIDRMLRISQAEQISGNFEAEIIALQEAESHMHMLLEKYMQSNVSVIEFYNELVGGQGSTEQPVTIDKFKAFVNDHLILPLENRIKETKEKSEKYYEELFLQVSKLAPFYKAHDLHLRASYVLLLWGLVPDKKDPQKIIVGTEDYRRVWRVDDSLIHVAENVMPRHVRWLVDRFFQPLTEIIDGTKKQLNEISRKLELRAHEAREARAMFQSKRNMQEKFVTYVV